MKGDGTAQSTVLLWWGCGLLSGVVAGISSWVCGEEEQLRGKIREMD